MVYLPATTRAQVDLSLQGSLFGPGLNWISVIVEAPVVQFNKGMSESIRMSIAYGAPWLNATYVPVQAHYILFRGNDHLEVFGGVALEVAWKPGADDGLRDLKSSQVNPAFGLGYRYESPRGGFVFRVGLDAMYVVAETSREWLPTTHLSVGHSFDL